MGVAPGQVVAVLLVHVTTNADLPPVSRGRVPAVSGPGLQPRPAGLGAAGPGRPLRPAAVLGAVGHHQVGALAGQTSVSHCWRVALPGPTPAVVALRVHPAVRVVKGALGPVRPVRPASVHRLGEDGTAEEVLLPLERVGVLVRGRHTLALLLVPPAVRVHRVQAGRAGLEPAAPLDGQAEHGVVRGDVETGRAAGLAQQLHPPHCGPGTCREGVEDLYQAGLLGARVVAQLLDAAVLRGHEDDVDRLVVLVLDVDRVHSDLAEPLEVLGVEGRGEDAGHGVVHQLELGAGQQVVAVRLLLALEVLVVRPGRTPAGGRAGLILEVPVEGGLHRRHVEVADGGPGYAVLAGGEGGVHHPLLRQVGGALDLVVVEGELARLAAVQSRLQECRPLVLQDGVSPLVVLTDPSYPGVDGLPAVHHLGRRLAEDEVHEVLRLELSHKVRLGQPLGVVLDSPQGIEVNIVPSHSVNSVVRTLKQKMFPLQSYTR